MINKRFFGHFLYEKKDNGEEWLSIVSLFLYSVLDSAAELFLNIGQVLLYVSHRWRTSVENRMPSSKVADV